MIDKNDFSASPRFCRTRRAARPLAAVGIDRVQQISMVPNGGVSHAALQGAVETEASPDGTKRLRRRR